MELWRQKSDLTDTAKRALATNRGQSECLKSTYGLLESEYKNKCSNLNAEQARFLRVMKTKLPAIKVSTDECELPKSKLLSPPESPRIGRHSPVTLPVLHDRRSRRSKSFSDLLEALSRSELESPREKTTERQKSWEQLYEVKLSDRRNNTNVPRASSWSYLDSSNLPVKGRSEKQPAQPFGSAATNKISSKNSMEPSRKLSTPARLTPLSISRVHETRKLTSKKPIDKQLEDVKDLRYLRSGKYTTEDEATEETSQNAKL